MVYESRGTFDEQYGPQGVAEFKLNVTSAKGSRIEQRLMSYITNPGQYCLTGQQCTSVACQSLVQAGVKISYSYYYVQTEPVPGVRMTGVISGTMGLTPSNFKEILQQPINKNLVSSYNYYKTPNSSW